MKLKTKFFYSLIIILLILAVSIKPPDLAEAQETYKIYLPLVRQDYKQDYKIYLPLIRSDRVPGKFFGMDGGTVECIAIDPKNSNIIYAGTWGNGIYKSNDGGVNWANMSENLQSPYIYDIAVDLQNSQHILASTYQNGVNQSFDGGKSWHLTSGLPGVSVVYSIEFHPQNSSVVYLGLREPTITNPDGSKEYPGGVFKSVDGGSTWEKKSNGLPDDYVYDVAIDPNDPDIMYTAMHATGVYKTTNSGDVWYSINRELPKDDLDIRSVDINPVNSYVYIAHWDGDGLSYSTDRGSNWVRVASTDASDLYVYEVLVDKNHPTTVYMVTATGVYVCENPNGASTCSLVNHSGQFVFDLALDLNGLIDASGKTKGMLTGLQHAGIYKSYNTGSSFTDTNNGIRANIINAFLIDPAIPSVQYASSFGRGIYKSENNGLNWTPINNGLSDLFVNTIVYKPGKTSTLYAGTQSKGVFISSDGGLNWTQNNTGLAASLFDDTMGIMPDNGLDFIDNFAYDWMDPIDRESLEILDEHKNLDRSIDSLNITTYSFDPSNSAKMIAGTNGAGVKYSNDSGMSWNSSYLTVGNVFDSFTDSSVGDNYYFIGLADSSVKVSNSSRLDWTNKNYGFHSSADVFTLEKASNGVYYAGTESGIYKTSNAGASWTRVGLINIKVTDILVDSSNINIVWAATQNGLYRSTNGGTNWTFFSIDGLLNKNILTLKQIPGKESFYIGTNGGNLYYFSP